MESTTSRWESTSASHRHSARGITLFSAPHPNLFLSGKSPPDPEGKEELNHPTTGAEGERHLTRKHSPSLPHIPQLRGGFPPPTQSRWHLQTQVLHGAPQKASEESCGRALALTPLPPQPCVPGSPLEGRLPCTACHCGGWNMEYKFSLSASSHGSIPAWLCIAPCPPPSPPALRVTPCLLLGKGEGGHGCHTFEGRQTRNSNLRLSQTFCHLSCQRYEKRSKERGK